MMASFSKMLKIVNDKHGHDCSILPFLGLLSAALLDTVLRTTTASAATFVVAVHVRCFVESQKGVSQSHKQNPTFPLSLFLLLLLSPILEWCKAKALLRSHQHARARG